MTQPPADAGSTEPASDAAIGRLEARIDELARSFDKRDALELMAAILLAIASVIAAWSAYQNARWGGEQAKSTAQAAALRTSGAQAATVAAAQMELDGQLFIAWLDHAATDGTTAAAATVFADRLRPEFRSIFDAWLATVPPGQIPPGTPMDTPAYDSTAVTADETAIQANELAVIATANAARANQTGDNYVLVAVIMATVLFFAGMGTRFGDRRLRRVLVAWAGVLLVLGVLFMLTQPISFGI